MLSLVEKPTCRAVVVSFKDNCVFQELIFANHLPELFTGDEEVFASILFGTTRLAGRVGDRELKVRHGAADDGNQRGFPRSGGRRDDEHIHHYSIFCTCSRAFSMSDFMASPASVILAASPANPEVLESRVLASRFISCKRKSIFLPTSPLVSSKAKKCCTWWSRRTNSSWMSLRSARTAA